MTVREVPTEITVSWDMTRNIESLVRLSWSVFLFQYFIYAIFKNAVSSLICRMGG
jgi:hypothetical protein